MTDEILGLLQAVLIVAIGLVALLGIRGCQNQSVHLHGEGATFPMPIYARWIGLYHRTHPDVDVRYVPAGSTRGIRAITERTAHFGASDALPNPSQLAALPAELLTLPTVLGPVVMVYNLPGFDGELTLDGESIAAIYLGEITRWNDSRLQALNPELELPDIEIRVAHRQDGSGTTFIFTDYLSSVSKQWQEHVGRGQQVNWPTESKWAGEGNDGVAHQILLLPGGLGYVELKYAQNAGLDYAVLINQEGHRVRPTVRSVQEAERNAPASKIGFIKPSIVNAPGRISYPICGYTYLLVYQDLTYLKDPAKRRALVDFLRWTLTEGQRHAADLHYTPLPEEVRKQTLGLVENIKTTEVSTTID